MNHADSTDDCRASIQALYELGKKKSYELVRASENGVNLFFVAEKSFDRFGIEHNSPEAFYRAPEFGDMKGGARQMGVAGGLPKVRGRLATKVGRSAKSLSARHGLPKSPHGMN